MIKKTGGRKSRWTVSLSRRRIKQRKQSNRIQHYIIITLFRDVYNINDIFSHKAQKKLPGSVALRISIWE